MDIDTGTGIKVSILNTDKSKVLSFDKTVKAIELSEEEAYRLGASLIREHQSGITAKIRELIDEGYFSEPRRFGDIRKELSQRGVPVKSASLNVILMKLVERGELERTGERGFYLYHT